MKSYCESAIVKVPGSNSSVTLLVPCWAVVAQWLRLRVVEQKLGVQCIYDKYRWLSFHLASLSCLSISHCRCQSWVKVNYS